MTLSTPDVACLQNLLMRSKVVLNNEMQNVLIYLNGLQDDNQESKADKFIRHT